jgi:hypothetical protein
MLGPWNLRMITGKKKKTRKKKVSISRKNPGRRKKKRTKEWTFVLSYRDGEDRIVSSRVVVELISRGKQEYKSWDCIVTS